MKYLLLVIFILLLFSVHVHRPIDTSGRNLWREVDVGSMARNFYREDMNIFYPRIDWRGDGPGYVEAEFPLGSWLGAVSYKLFGYQEWYLRLISLLATLGSCFVLYRLTKFLTDERAAFLSVLIFVLNPIVFVLSTAIQPEPLMLLAYLFSIYFFVRWLDTKSTLRYFLALLSLILAILIKLPAAHIFILFALLSLQHFGFKALINPQLWVFILFGLGIPLLWYEHARNLWLEYGNSLGISNEAYARIGTATYEEFKKINIYGNLFSEFKRVWLGFGVLLGFFGAYSFTKVKQGNILLFWGIALLLYYILSGGTTGEEWASYYHIVTVPFAAILISAGYYFLADSNTRWKRILGHILISLFLLTGIGVFYYLNFIKTPPDPGIYLSAQRFKPLLPENVLIISNGSSLKDPQGRIMAGNVPYYFFWLDRKGFNMFTEMQTMQNLNAFKARGARYFVIDKTFIPSAPDFYKELLRKYKIVDETNNAILLDLTSEKQ